MSSCPYCGAEISGTLSYCTNCGAPLERTAPQTPVAGNVQQQPVSQNYANLQEKKKGSGKGLYMILAVVAVIGICVIAFSLSSDKQENVRSEPVATESAVNNNQQGVVAKPEKDENNNNVRTADNSHIISVFESSCDREGSYVHNAAKAFDSNFKSCWTEGVQGNGIGEYIGAKFDGKQKISGLKIWIGHQKSEELFYKNSVPLSFMVVTADGNSVSCQVQDVMGEQTITFDQPIITDEVKIVIDNVREGNKWQDTCITEVRFF